MSADDVPWFTEADVEPPPREAVSPPVAGDVVFAPGQGVGDVVASDARGILVRWRDTREASIYGGALRDLSKRVLTEEGKWRWPLCE